MNFIEIKGKVNTAHCYAKVVENEAIEQIRRMCDYPMTEGYQIRIMPDVHSGKGCTIGTTSLDAGMNAHLAKPIEPQKIYDTIAQLIEC